LLAGAIRSAVSEIDHDQPLADLSTMQQVLGKVIAGRRLNAMLLGFFGGLALVLAGIGVFGVVSFSVAGRTREIGIRVAMGASPAAVVRAIVRDSLKMGLAGIAIGGLGTALASRLLERFLFGVHATDVATLAGVAGLLLSIIVAGTYLPARRALRVDPWVALREE
jgi:putative ABC transport system permease protein